MKYLRLFLKHLELEKNYSEHTLINYETDLTKFINYFNKLDIKEITHNDIRNYLLYLHEQNYSAKTISRHISSLKSFYKYLTIEHNIKNNPLTLITLPKTSKNIPTYMNYSELDTLLKIPKDNMLGVRNRLILELLYATGIRVSELVNIKIKDININENTILILGKNKKERIVFFKETCKYLIKDYLNLRNDTIDYLFINKNYTKLTDRGVRHIISLILKESNLNTKITPHTFRHTFATHLLNEGADLKVVQELLGHSNIKTTGIYTHVSNEKLRNVYLNTHPRAKDNLN